MSLSPDPATSCNTAGRVLVPEKVCVSLRDFTARVGKLYGVDLPTVDTENMDVPSLKKFCGGLLEPSGRHLWASTLRQLPAVDRLSVAGSLFSFRKLLPTPDVDIPAYAERMSTTSQPGDPRLLRFISREVRKMFPPGWDRSWRKFVLSTSPSGSACTTKSRASGGARSELLGRREWFLRACMGTQDFTIPSTRKLGKVVDSGKSRIVSSSPWESIVLSPLHKMIYSRLSRFDWLLRGEADPGSFSDEFVRKQGEVFVSGDYESATDNLKVDVATHILREILSTARYVPKTIKREAISSLTCLLAFDGGLVAQRRGQLMGNYLSFPLLCLQNYLAFRFLAGPSYPVRINGDDIVFRAPTSVYTRWADGVSSAGLTLSLGKTFVHPRFFSLNSKYFRAKSVKEPVVVPILRASCLYKYCEDPNQIAGWVNNIGEGFDDRRASWLHVAVLQRNMRAIRSSQRSVTRGLGVNVTPSTIVKAGFKCWESFYLAQAEERAPPLKRTFGTIPHGWAKISCPLGGNDDPGFGAACVQSAWKVRATRTSVDDYWTHVRRFTVPYKPRRKEWWRKAAKLAGLTTAQCRTWLDPVIEIPRRQKRVWHWVGD